MTGWLVLMVACLALLLLVGGVGAVAGALAGLVICIVADLALRRER